MEDFGKNIMKFVDQEESLSSYFDSYGELIEKMKDSMGTNSIEVSIKDGMIQLLEMVKDYNDDEGNFVKKIKELNREKKLIPEEIIDDPKAILEYLTKSHSSDSIKFQIKNNNLSLVFVSPDIEAQFMNSLKKMKSLFQQQTFFNHTALLALTNTYESFLAIIMKDAIKRNIDKPTSLGKDKKSLTIDEILKFETFDEAKEYLINDTISTYFREPKANTIKRICEYIKKSLFEQEFSEKSEVVNEVFMRRNLVVHNNGVANDEYINKVPERLRKNATKDKEILVDSRYLHKSLTELSMIYLELFYKYWSFIDRNEDEKNSRYQTYNLIGYRKLTDGNYQIAEKIYQLMYGDIQRIAGDVRLMIEINYAQSLKWQGSHEAFKKVRRKIDFSLTKDPHLMCKYLLDDDFENASIVLQKILEDKSHPEDTEYTNINFYAEWPIFRDFRKSDAFKELVRARENCHSDFNALN